MAIQFSPSTINLGTITGLYESFTLNVTGVTSNTPVTFKAYKNNLFVSEGNINISSDSTYKLSISDCIRYAKGDKNDFIVSGGCDFKIEIFVNSTKLFTGTAKLKVQTVTITSPINGATYTDSTHPTLTVNCLNYNGTTFYVQLNGNSASRTLFEAQGNDFDYSLDLNSKSEFLVNGQNTVSIHNYDTGGQLDYIKYTMEQAELSPTAVIQGFADGLVTNKIPKITITFANANGKKYYVELNGADIYYGTIHGDPFTTKELHWFIDNYVIGLNTYKIKIDNKVLATISFTLQEPESEKQPTAVITNPTDGSTLSEHPILRFNVSNITTTDNKCVSLTNNGKLIADISCLEEYEEYELDLKNIIQVDEGLNKIEITTLKNGETIVLATVSYTKIGGTTEEPEEPELPDPEPEIPDNPTPPTGPTLEYTGEDNLGELATHPTLQFRYVNINGHTVKHTHNDISIFEQRLTTENGIYEFTHNLNLAFPWEGENTFKMYIDNVLQKTITYSVRPKNTVNVMTNGYFLYPYTEEPPEVYFAVNNTLGDPMDIEFQLNGVTFNTIKNAELNAHYYATIDKSRWDNLEPTTHTIKCIGTVQNYPNEKNIATFEFTKERKALTIKSNNKTGTIDLGDIAENPEIIYFEVVPYGGVYPNGYTQKTYVRVNNTTRLDLTNTTENGGIHLGKNDTINIPQNIWDNLPYGKHHFEVHISNNNFEGTMTFNFNKVEEVAKVFETTVDKKSITTNIGFTFNYTIDNTYAMNTNVRIFIEDDQIDTFAVTNGSHSYIVPTSIIANLEQGLYRVKIEFSSTGTSEVKTHYIDVTVPEPGKAVINCTNTNMGEISDTFIANFTVSTTKVLQCYVKLNGNVIDEFYVNGYTDYQATPGNYFYSLPESSHKLSIVVIDDGVEIVHDILFKKVESSITVQFDYEQIEAIMDNFSVYWTARDNTSDQYTLRVYANQALLETKVINNGIHYYNMPNNLWDSISYGKVDMELRFIGSNNVSKSIFLTFTKINRNGIDFYTPVYITDKMPEYVYISMDKDIKSGAKLYVQICCNPFSSTQTWINITNQVNVDYYKLPVFENDSTLNGILVRITVDKGTSTQASSVGNLLLHYR